MNIPSDINSPRRVTIDRNEILYGQTPLGMQKMHLERLASMENKDLIAMCNNIISINEEQRFAMLQNYYKNVDQCYHSFFSNFENYKTEKTKENIHNRVQGKEENNVLKSCDETASFKNLDNLTSSNDNAPTNVQRQYRDETFKNLPNSIHPKIKNSKKMPPLPFISNISKAKNSSQSTTKPVIINNHKNSDTISDSDINENNSSASSNLNDEKYGSVMASLLFDNSNSKLKHIVKNKAKSPKKYETILESLLFE